MTISIIAAIALLLVFIVFIAYCAFSDANTQYVGFANKTITFIRNGGMSSDDIKLLRDSIRAQKETYDAKASENEKQRTAI